MLDLCGRLRRGLEGEAALAGLVFAEGEAPTRAAARILVEHLRDAGLCLRFPLRAVRVGSPPAPTLH